MSIPAPMKTLIFHIGHHKTGSTSIQEAFATGRVQVKGARILYPGQMNHNHLPRHFEAFAKSGKALKGAPGQPGLTLIAAQLQAGDFDYAVLSGEEFERMAPDRFAAVLQATLLPHVDDHAVICYVRPHAARLLSSYAEQVKLGIFAGGLKDFYTRLATRNRLHFAPQMAAWTEVFGMSFRAKPMVHDLMEAGSTVQDFARLAFGPEAQISVAEGTAANESLCLEDLVMLRHIQSHMKAHVRLLRHEIGRTLAMAMANTRRTGSRTKLALPRGLAERARRDYLADARALDAGIFAATPVMARELDRAVDLALSEPQSMEPTDHFSPEELRNVSILAELLADMLHKDSDGWRSFLLDRRVSGLLGADATPVNPDRKKGTKRAGGGGPKPGMKAGLKRAGAKVGGVQGAGGKVQARKAGGGKVAAGKAGGGKRRQKAAEA